MQNRPLLLALALGASLVAGAATRASAVASNSAQAGVSPNFTGGSGPWSANATQPGVIDLAGSATGGFSSSGSVLCNVHYGSTRGSGSSHGSLSSQFRGIFRDTLFVTAPGVPTGTAGTLTFHVRVDGTLGATNGFSSASWSLQADLGGGVFDMNRGGHANSPEVFPSGYSGDPITTFGATVPFQFGKPISLDVELGVNAGAGNGSTGPGAASFDFGAYWAGIDSVKSGSVFVPNYTVTSVSGTAYGAAPVAVTTSAPNGTRLERIAPNPAIGPAQIAFDLAREGDVRLEIVDVNGRSVKHLRSGALAAGRYSLAWTREDDSGHPVAPGVYFVRLRAPGADRAAKVIVAR